MLIVHVIFREKRQKSSFYIKDYYFQQKCYVDFLVQNMKVFQHFEFRYELNPTMKTRCHNLAMKIHFT